ncbi:MAG: hypothetical protein ACD_12C00811G0001 [uncultured bacterium]|nr:MAG: hypothetical protein ACD_12C00811G0001 [uncultured bacterium]
MRRPIILDLETQYTFRDFADPKKLRISVVGIYDYKDCQLKAFFDHELNKLYPLLENASLIIGFNIDSFDLPVLQGYYPGEISQFKTFDLLADIKNILKRRVALNDLAKATLNKQKSGHGLEAVNYFKEGKLEKLKKYCLDDVSLTKEIFEYGIKHKEIFYPSLSGKSLIKINWGIYLQNNQVKNDVSLTLPF